MLFLLSLCSRDSNSLHEQPVHIPELYLSPVNHSIQRAECILLAAYTLHAERAAGHIRLSS